MDLDEQERLETPEVGDDEPQVGDSSNSRVVRRAEPEPRFDALSLS